jgi:menaquinone-9 beta-reductase
MESCDVLIVGGGPAGSTCAWKLRQAGLDVLLMDREPFPRDKPCAGWITPEVIAALEIDREEYCRGRVLQNISGFHTGLMGGAGVVTRYGATVSYGIRRCEFDHFLLERSGVRRALGEPVSAMERSEKGWLVNGRISARLVIGAGGHFCPVARRLGAKIGRENVIVAQATEFAMSRDQERLCTIPADQPSLYFCRDMKGYGWLFRKGRYLNVGLGRMDRTNLGRHTRDFRKFLKDRGYLPSDAACTFRGHAYLLYSRQGGRDRLADGALLIGDAAGLSFPQSGEGILPAIQSALLASDTILGAGGDYRRDNLEPYAAALAARFGNSELRSPEPASGLLRRIGASLLSSRWFTRHVVLDSWFLHNH